MHAHVPDPGVKETCRAWIATLDACMVNFVMLFVLALLGKDGNQIEQRPCHT